MNEDEEDDEMKRERERERESGVRGEEASDRSHVFT